MSMEREYRLSVIFQSMWQGIVPMYGQTEGLFVLDEKGFPTEVAGCPPDAFAEDGQKWEIRCITGMRWRKTDLNGGNTESGHLRSCTISSGLIIL